MKRFLPYFFVFILIINSIPVAFAAHSIGNEITRPSAPVAPDAPSSRPTPPPIPERSGDYADPENPLFRVRVFVHDERGRHNTSQQSQAVCIDPDSQAMVGAGGWRLPQGGWTYNLNPSSAPSSVGSSNLPTIAQNGFNAWQASQSKVTFSRGLNTSRTRQSYDRVNLIAWGRLSGNYLGVTYIRYYTASGIVVDVDTILNRRVKWSWYGNNGSCGDPNSYDAENILIHEQGHWLGLDDEYDLKYNNNTMFGYGYTGDIRSVTLTTGDKLGAAAIYP